MIKQETIDSLSQERARQHIKWGEQNHDDITWLGILAEEFGEAAKEANETHFRSKSDEELKTELAQVAAVCVAWLESIERRNPSGAL